MPGSAAPADAKGCSALLRTRSALPLLTFREHEFRHLPFVADREQAEGEAEDEGQARSRSSVVEAQAEGGRVEQAGRHGERWRRARCGTAAAPRCRGCRAARRRRSRSPCRRRSRSAARQSICQATSQPAMVNTTSPMASSTRKARLSRSTSRASRMVTKRRAACDRKIDGMRDPEQRIMPEQHVADGAAAERGDGARACRRPAQSMLRSAGCQRRRHRLRRDRDEREHVQHQIGGRHGPH